eukprot:38183_1
MPSKLAKYFKLFDKTKKSSTWLSDLRAEYVKLFGLQDFISTNNNNESYISCYDNICNDEEYIPASKEIDLEPVEAANYVSAQDMTSSTEYLYVMEDHLQHKKCEDETIK